VERVLAAKPEALRFRNGHSNDAPVNVAIHAHCHAKSLLKPGFMPRLVERLPGRKAVLLETGCCGMAGAFGALASKYELSLQVAEPLMNKIKEQPAQTEIVASGTSCRHQIEHLSALHPRHMAEIIAEALA
jgi:Fe-S oxidoreductase